MTISLSEFKANLDRYMKAARVMEVRITDGDEGVTWILSSPKSSSWASLFRPLVGKQNKPCTMAS